MTSSNNNIDNIAGSYQYNLSILNTFFPNSLNSAKFAGSGLSIGESGVNNWLATANLSNVATYDEFVQKFAQEAQLYANNPIPGSITDPADVNSPFYNFYRIYTSANGYTTPGSSPSNNDLSLIENPSIISAFKQKFANFLATLKANLRILSDLPTDGTDVTVNSRTFTPNLNNNSDNFYLLYASTFNTTAVISNANLITAGQIFGTNVDPNIDTNYVQSFQTIYEAFHGPIGTIPADPILWTEAQATYVSRLRAFYNSQIATNGDFSATNALSNWYEYSLNLYTNPSYSPDPSNYDENSTLILNELLLSLISMIGTIQRTAATQAQQLSFLAAWQNAYTNKLNQVRIFARLDGTDLGFGPDKKEWNDNDSRKSKFRDSLNTINQNYIARLQGNQANISDTAKALQTNVNQSNDAANQQGSIADSILSQLSTILSAIFR